MWDRRVLERVLNYVSISTTLFLLGALICYDSMNNFNKKGN